MCQRHCDWCLLNRTEAKRVFCLKDGQKELASVYSSSLCVSKVKCVCLGSVLCAFDFLQLYAASRQQGGSRQECNSTHMHTQKGTRPQFYEMHHLKYTPRCSNDVCIPAVIVFVGMHTYEQTSIRAGLGSDSVMTAMLGFFRGKTVSIYMASKGHLEPSVPWKAIEESSSTPSLHMSLSHSFFLSLCPHNNCWQGWAWSRWTTASPHVCSTPIIYVHWRWCKVLERLLLSICLPSKLLPRENMDWQGQAEGDAGRGVRRRWAPPWGWPGTQLLRVNKH